MTDDMTDTESPGDDEGRWRNSLAVPVVIIAVAVGLIVAIIVLAQQDQGSGRAALSGTTLDQTTLPVTVPYREVAGYIVLDVTLGQGSRTVPMILDTGAPTIVSEEIAEVFSSGSAGTISTASADGQVINSDVVVLPQLSIGGARFDDVGAVLGAIEPGNPFYCVSDAGFIGASLMQTGVWQIDPLAGTVTIASSTAELEHLDDAIRLDFARASDVSPSPLVPIRVAEGSLALVLDTGSDGWLTVNPHALDEVGLDVPADAPSQEILSTTAAGIVSTRASWIAADLGFGDEEHRLPLAAAGLLPAGQGDAGTDFLRHFVVTIDWVEDVAYLSPLGDELAPAVPASAGLAWDEGFVVGSFVLGVPGTEGLVLDTDVVALDGRDVTRAPFDDFCARMLDGPATYEMTVAGELPSTVDVAPVEDFFEALADGN
jgi:predicted aspartyl protease